MPENSVQMDWGMLERLFQEIDNILPDEKRERIVLFGGAAISYFNRIRVSVDADAFSGKFSPELKKAIETVGANNNLGPDWLNDAAPNVPTNPDIQPQLHPAFGGKKLTVFVPDLEFLLATKLASRRQKDIQDIIYLVNEIGLESSSEILNLAESVLHPSQMTPQLQAFVTNLAEELNQQ